jgi:prolyl-tRNA synthetase
MSTLFLRTLREDPADAEVPSHRLLVRAGYIRRTAAGIYSWLPLGKRLLDNVAGIVRAEMEAIGGQEILLPALVPREPYEATGRWSEYGPEMFRLRDRRGADYCLGPTHEELMTLLVKAEYSSYKDLPLTLFQIQTKYRDELRPRSGVIRGREFLMKDSYSFNLDDEDLLRSYADHRRAYARIFDRLGLDTRIVAAVSGAMGGSRSEEFLAPAAVGEDTFVSCGRCAYAANVEAAQGASPDPGSGNADAQWPPMTELHTPGVPGIDAVVAHLDPGDGTSLTAAGMLKTMLYLVDGQPVAVVLPGNREVVEERLAAALTPADVALFDEADFAARPDLVRGYAGPQGMAERGVRVLADVRVGTGTSWVTGANRMDHHVRNAVAGRDFTADDIVDVATVAAGDPCPRCGAPLEMGRAIEVGHIFQLGRKYTTALELQVSGPDGALVTVTMGSYGIGVGRAVAAVAEQTADAAGLCWPAAISPADVHLVALGKGGQLAAAEKLAVELERAGVRVLLDDRGTSAGIAFKDAELIGIPTIVIVGKALAAGEIEVQDRRSGHRQRVPLAEAVAALTPAG